MHLSLPSIIVDHLSSLFNSTIFFSSWKLLIFHIMLETNIINTCCELFFFFLMKLDIKTDWPLKTCGSCFTMFGSEGKNDQRIHSCFPSPLINSSLLTTNYKKGFIFKDVVDSFGVKTSKWILKGKHGISWYFNLRRMRFMKYAFLMHALGQCVYDAS